MTQRKQLLYNTTPHHFGCKSIFLNVLCILGLNKTELEWTISLFFYLDFSILRSSGQHLCVSTEAHTQHCIIHHHEIILSLVLEILQDRVKIYSKSMTINKLLQMLFGWSGFVPFWFCLWWSSKPQWNHPQSQWPGTDHQGRTVNTPHEISVQTVNGRIHIRCLKPKRTSGSHPRERKNNNSTLMCLLSWVGKRSSSTSFTAALPLNKSMVIPGGRRPWCCCHFSDWWRRNTLTFYHQQQTINLNSRFFNTDLSQQS